MSTADVESKHVCHCCTKDRILADEIETAGSVISCSYCGVPRKAFDLYDLATRIHGVVQEQFQRTSSEPNWYESILLKERMLDFWVPDGEPVTDVIAEVAGLSEEIAEDVTAELSGRYAYEAAKYGEENPYDSEAYYEEREPDSWVLRYNWRSFRSEIMYQERIFPENAEPVLEEIFGDLNTLTTYDGTPVVWEVNPKDEFPIWRARRSQSKDELIAILKNPSEQLGPPPHKLAHAGRMNQVGIPVFYGALEEITCVNEVRPIVGGQVVLGKFDLLRPVRLLNLGALSKVFVDASHFDPDYEVIRGRASFIRSLVDEISRPVMPQEAEREYLPTQFVASYLARKVSPNFDGIIFPSSQAEGNGRNVVLFNRARGVEKHDLPEGSEVEVRLPSSIEEDDGVSIFETVPLNISDNEASVEEASVEKPRGGPIQFFVDEDEPEEPDENIPVTLKLDIDSVYVIDIKGVTHDPKKRRVWRHRQTTEERDRFNRHFTDADWDSLLDMPDQETPEDQV